MLRLRKFAPVAPDRGQAELDAAGVVDGLRPDEIRPSKLVSWKSADCQLHCRCLRLLARMMVKMTIGTAHKKAMVNSFTSHLAFSP